jgi:uracil-DNA glycosylase
MSIAGKKLLRAHVDELLSCKACAGMHKPVVSGGPVWSKILLVGQAPGDKEPVMGRPFAWTAGRTLFKWFEESCGISEQRFRESIYMAAVCRCFPGKKATGGDRVPSLEEIRNCSGWLDREIKLLKPELIIPVGKLAIQQFLAVDRMDEVIGRRFRVSYRGHRCDVIPLPHPSGASPWHRMEPGRTLLGGAMKMICAHPAMQEVQRSKTS